MSACQDQSLLSAYLDQEINIRDQERIKFHLASCDSCRSELESLRLTKATLFAAPRRAAPPELIARIEGKLSGPFPSYNHSWTGGLPRLGIPVGALATALIAALWLGLKQKDPDHYLPLEPLMTAHSRYTAESLVPQGTLASSDYSLLAYGDYEDPDAD